MTSVLLVAQIILGLLLISVILLQKTGADGLSGLSGSGTGASGGLVTAHSAASFLTKLTVILVMLFMANSILLANLSAKTTDRSSAIIEKVEKKKEQADAAPIAD